MCMSNCVHAFPGVWVPDGPALDFIGCCWPLLACVGCRGPALAFVGLRGCCGLALAFVGLRWLSLVFIGLRWQMMMPRLLLPSPPYHLILIWICSLVNQSRMKTTITFMTD